MCPEAAPTTPASGASGAGATGDLATLVRRFETLGPADCADLVRHYRPDARFKDPFNDVVGRPAIEAIYRHMFVQLDGPRFRVTGQLGDRSGGVAVLFWTFTFRFRPSWATRGRTGEQRIEGATRLTFDENGLIVTHRDFWDPAEELYEKLPVLGTLMHWIRRRGGSSPSG